MRRAIGGWAAVAVLAFSGLALAGDGGKPKRPQLDLRATPRVSFSPVEILVVGQLKGGSDLEEFYCPGLEWDWGDGSHSSHESDCAPYEAGMDLERFFSARHAYREPGDYAVRLTLRRASRTVAVGTIAVAVRGRTAGLNDF